VSLWGTREDTGMQPEVSLLPALDARETLDDSQVGGIPEHIPEDLQGCRCLGRPLEFDGVLQQNHQLITIQLGYQKGLNTWEL
ncbi:hypothetical protein P7K49_019094, partial [Saguinus oedipus]